MKVITTPLVGVLIFEPTLHRDERGQFFEAFSQAAFDDALRAHGLATPVCFVQDNESQSRPNVLRGIHFQLAPHAQGKLIRVVAGSVWDVAVDLRPASPTYLRSFQLLLSEENHRQLWIPEGFGHGFLALEQGAKLLYKVTRRYSPGAERTLPWNSQTLAVPWPTEGRQPVVSAKDDPSELDFEATMKEVEANPWD